MKTGRTGLRGHAPIVSVGPYNPAEQAMVERIRAILVGRKVEDVILHGEQMTIQADDGGTLSFNLPGGFKEVS